MKMGDRVYPLYGIFLAVLSLISLCLYGAGVASPYWIEKDFIFPTPELAAVMNVPPVKVESNIGLLWACTDQTVQIPALAIVSTTVKCKSLHDIDSDLVEDWQWAAAVMGVIALLATFSCFVMACVAAYRGTRENGIRAAIIFLNLFACALLIAVIALFAEKKSIKINSNLSFRMEYDISWGIHITIVSAVLFFFTALFNVLFIRCIPAPTKKSTDHQESNKPAT